MQLEIITRQPAKAICHTPVLFVHGAWHAAWCWDAYFLPYFAAQGFTAHAVSFRNHGRSASAGSLRWRRSAEYVRDIAQAVREIGQPPVLVAHSLGGYVVQKYLETARVPAVALLASAPPSGVLGATQRVARRHPLLFLKANIQARLWPIISSPALAREAFFSRTLPEAQVRHYAAQLQDEAYLAYLDSMFLNLPRRKRVARVPMLVLGAANDQIFTTREIRATARAYGATGRIFPAMAHDMMLEPGWQAVADHIIRWLRQVPGVC